MARPIPRLDPVTRATFPLSVMARSSQAVVQHRATGWAFAAWLSLRRQRQIRAGGSLKSVPSYQPDAPRSKIDPSRDFGTFDAGNTPAGRGAGPLPPTCGLVRMGVGMAEQG